MADLPRTSFRFGLGLALAVVGLFEVLPLPQGVPSSLSVTSATAGDPYLGGACPV